MTRPESIILICVLPSVYILVGVYGAVAYTKLINFRICDDFNCGLPMHFAQFARCSIKMWSQQFVAVIMRDRGRGYWSHIYLCWFWKFHVWHFGLWRQSLQMFIDVHLIDLTFWHHQWSDTDSRWESDRSKQKFHKNEEWLFHFTVFYHESQFHSMQ